MGKGMIMAHKVSRHENLYPQVYDWDNLLLAYRKASKGKRGNPAVAAFEYHAEQVLLLRYSIRRSSETSFAPLIGIARLLLRPAQNEFCYSAMAFIGVANPSTVLRTGLVSRKFRI
jgi:hypothetical protein